MRDDHLTVLQCFIRVMQDGAELARVASRQIVSFIRQNDPHLAGRYSARLIVVLANLRPQNLPAFRRLTEE